MAWPPQLTPGQILVLRVAGEGGPCLWPPPYRGPRCPGGCRTPPSVRNGVFGSPPIMGLMGGDPHTGGGHTRSPTCAPPSAEASVLPAQHGLGEKQLPRPVAPPTPTCPPSTAAAPSTAPGPPLTPRLPPWVEPIPPSSHCPPNSPPAPRTPWALTAPSPPPQRPSQLRVWLQGPPNCPEIPPNCHKTPSRLPWDPPKLP